MKRILWMVLMNLWYVPYGIIRLFRMAAHPERYSLEERYALIRQIDNRAIKGGRVVIQGDGMDRLPKDDGFILYPNHQGMFDVLAILWLLDRPVSVVLKKELQNIPFLKQVFACLGAYALDRSDPRQGMKVMLQMAEDVKNSRNFIIFPEGTRSRDNMNMGACMAPAACDTIERNLQDFRRTPSDYDRIITGDLGAVGKRILLDLLEEKGIDIGAQHMDCGIEIYDSEVQDTHSGGSGCGCAASTLSALILPKLRRGSWKRVLFVPTGALLSKVSFNEGKTIPGIAHAIILEHC